MSKKQLVAVKDETCKNVSTREKIPFVWGKDGVVELMGFSGYTEDEKTFILSPESEDGFVEYKGVSSLGNILSKGGANIYPKNIDLLFALVIRPFVAIDWILRGFITLNDMEAAIGKEKMIIKDFEFFTTEGTLIDCVLIVLKSQHDLRYGMHPIYAMGFDGKVL